MNRFLLRVKFTSKARFANMPKAKDSKKPSKELLNSTGPFSEDKSGNILIRIHAKPGAKIDTVTDLSEESVGVQINAPPVDGEANNQLIKYFSQLLGVKKSEISLEKARSKSREKVLQICKGALSINEITNIIRDEAKK